MVANRRRNDSVVAGEGPDTSHLLPPGEKWMEQANCIGVPPDSFFPTTRQRSYGGPRLSWSEKQENTASTVKRICGRCPVQEECLEYALKTEQRYGIWGGLTANGRKAVLRQREKEVRVYCRADELQVGDVIRKPIKLRGAEIASITTVEGHIVAYVIGHPDPNVKKFHSPPDFPGFQVNRPKTVNGQVLYERGDDDGG